MWHQIPRASVCYYKLLLLPHSYLNILKLMAVLTKETMKFLHASVCPLRADEGKVDTLYAVRNFKSRLSSI